MMVLMLTGKKNLNNAITLTGSTATGDYSLSERLSGVAQRVIDDGGRVKGDVCSLSRALTLLRNAIIVVDSFCGISADCRRFYDKLGMTKNMMDVFLIGSQVSYFVGSEYRQDREKKNYLGLAGNAIFGVVSAGTILDTLNEVTLISFSNISASLGEIPVLGMVAKTGVSFGTALTVGVGIGYVCFAVEAFQKYKEISGQSEQNDKKNQKWWEVVWLVSEVVSKLAMLNGATLSVRVVLGSIAAGLGIHSFLSDKSKSSSQSQSGEKTFRLQDLLVTG